MTTTRKPRVLFLCTGNTARSQMAEALLRDLAPERFDVMSAGLEPGEVNPYTIRALTELGIDASGLHAKGLRPMIGREHFEYLVTVCDRAEQNCPIFPGVSQRLAWPFEDPAAFEGDDAATLAKFREVRDAIKVKLEGWLREQPTTKAGFAG